jgi:DNA-binding NtrC family response regulator
MNAHLLIVARGRSRRGLCGAVARRLGVVAYSAESAPQALHLLNTQAIDVVLADAGMPGLNVLDLLKSARENSPEADVVVMADPPNADLAQKAIKQGACDCILQPFESSDLERLLGRIVQQKQLSLENRLLREQLETRRGLGALIGSSLKMQKVYEMILKVAPKRHPVLVLGESGTGKELVARAIHSYGPWRDLPFVPVDCRALSATLIESELFGHVRGAFTGANQNRSGLLVAAGKGTVFLDEIAELPVELQAKLLRAIQEREVRPVGSNQCMPLEARLIAGTNQHLEGAITRGTFRKD